MREVFRKVGFFMLGILSLLYVVFGRIFAEMRLQLPFLNFPIFVGEIFLFICLILSFFVFDFRSIKGWQRGVVFYFACVIAKAIWGYSLWGPLAFRHAALFYYPIFIFFGFIFYKKAVLSGPLKIFIAFLIFAVCIKEYLCEYWILTLWVIAFILIRSFRNRATGYFFYIGLLLVAFFSHKVSIMTSRTFIVGNIVAAAFLITTLLLIAKIKVFYKVAIAGAFFMLLTAFVYKYSSFNASGTILNIETIINKYQMSDAELKFRQPYYVPQEFSDIKLFNPEQSSLLNEPKKDLNEGTRIKQRKVLTAEMKTRGPYYGLQGVEAVESPVPKQHFPLFSESGRNDKTVPKVRSAEDAYGNILFRLFIWRDMVSEFSMHWPILGFSFGRPLRSVSLEILNWANGDWMRDGWIEPHNSYLNMLYRMGIFGAALICFLIWQFCSIMRSFISLKSSTGILLCSILIIWLSAANFLPILELPYNAIPFWAFWGVTLGYLKELKDER